MCFYVIDVRLTGKNLVLESYSSSPPRRFLTFALAFAAYYGVLPVSRSEGKPNRAPKGLKVIVGTGFRLSGSDELARFKLSRKAMRFSSIAIASLQHARRFGAAGMFLLGSVVLAGSDSPILRRSLSTNGIQTVYALPRGATSFVIRLPGPAKDRSLYFVNQNAATQGQLLIAVSNQPLLANSPFWNAVEGAIRFRHKRLFAVSLVGVEAKYVRLTFQVEASAGDTKNDFPIDHLGRYGARNTSALPRRIVKIGLSSTATTL